MNKNRASGTHLNAEMNTVLLTTCNNSAEAYLIKGMLENNGIRCFVANENFSGLMPGFNGILGAGVQIIVEESDVEKARKLIEPTPMEDGMVCPNCHSSNVQLGLGPNKIRKIFVMLMALFSGIPFGNIKNTYYCHQCKAEFKIE